MLNKKIYAIQPYMVGQKERPSTAIIIPSILVKEFRIDKNSILILKPEKNRKITIETITKKENTGQKEMRSADKRFEASNQQISNTLIP